MLRYNDSFDTLLPLLSDNIVRLEHLVSPLNLLVPDLSIHRAKRLSSSDTNLSLGSVQRHRLLDKNLVYLLITLNFEGIVL